MMKLAGMFLGASEACLAVVRWRQSEECGVSSEQVTVAVPMVPRAVVLDGGAMDGHVVPDVVVETTAVLVMRDASTETWWTYERMLAPCGLALLRKGMPVYGEARCGGVTGMRLLKNAEMLKTEKLKGESTDH